MNFINSIYVFLGSLPIYFYIIAIGVLLVLFIYNIFKAEQALKTEKRKRRYNIIETKDTEFDGYPVNIDEFEKQIDMDYRSGSELNENFEGNFPIDPNVFIAEATQKADYLGENNATRNKR